MRKIILYQILTRIFGNKNNHLKTNGTIGENGVGKMNDITEKALSELRLLGVTDVWYTGIIEHATQTAYPNIPANAPETVKGWAGSPYAIRDYYDIAPDLATDIDLRMNEFEALVERTHHAGLRVWLDFVPNHIARQYHSDTHPETDFCLNDDTGRPFAPNNNCYYLPGETLQLPTGNYTEIPAKVTGNDCFSAHPTSNDWYETVKLNYGVDYQNGGTQHFNPIPDTWHKMLNILQFWASKGIDGFRCDMAEMVPVAFWQWAMAQLKTDFPHIKFIAEIYQPALYQDFISTAGFDFLYDKVGLYDTLRSLIEQRNEVASLTRCWESLHGLDAQMLRFLENHDEQRVASPQFAGDPFKALPAMVVAATMNVGPVMIYFGQEVGERAAGVGGFSGNDGRTSIFDYDHAPEHQRWMNGGAFDGGQLTDSQRQLRQFYHDLFHLCTRHAISEGAFYDLLWANQHLYNNKVYVYLRYTAEERLLFVLNFSDNQSFTGKIVIPSHAFQCMELSNRDFQFVPIFGVGEEQCLSQNSVETNGIEIHIAENQFVIYEMKDEK